MLLIFSTPSGVRCSPLSMRRSTSRSFRKSTFFFVLSGWLKKKGTIPVNPSGGLIACGHPVGATGLMQAVFAFWQIQGSIKKHFGSGELQLGIPAVAGTMTDSDFLNGDGVKITKRNTIEVSKKTLATEKEGIFAAGDNVRGPATAVEAVGDGKRAAMAIDDDKIDRTVLALLQLTPHDNGRAWKGHDWDVLGWMYEKGMIFDPVSKAKSVLLTDEG